MPNRDWGDLLPKPAAHDGVDSAAYQSREAVRPYGVDEWLWRLDQVQQGIEKLPDSIEVAISIELLRPCDCVSGTVITVEGCHESNSFPLGRCLSCDYSFTTAYWAVETGLWFEFGSRMSPKLMRWDDFTLHGAIEPDEAEIRSQTAKWQVWHYVKLKHGQNQDDAWLTSVERYRERVELYEVLQETCERAPLSIVEKIGCLSGFCDWPSALLYLALRRVHPLLTACGTDCRGLSWPVEIVEIGGSKRRQRKPRAQSKPRGKAFGDCNDFLIMISPSVVTATQYALEAFRQAAKTSSSIATPPKDDAGGGNVPKEYRPTIKTKRLIGDFKHGVSVDDLVEKYDTGAPAVRQAICRARKAGLLPPAKSGQRDAT
ncbi:MAG: hypothetical protein LLG00_10430 [Planctomycetaceae bacterium]|nr:hypothetical protein [Planctomycetaceae bacterium]